MATTNDPESSSKSRGRRIAPADIDRLIEISGRLFAVHGFDGVGMRKIAADSGIHLSSIQYHFESKEALFEEVLERKYDAFYHLILTSVTSAKTPEERLASAIGTLFNSLLKDEVFLMLLHRDIVDMIGDRYRTAFLEGYSKYRSLAKKLLEETLKRPIDSAMMFALISVILGYTELAMALRRGDARLRDDDTWLAEQRSRMIEIVNRICMM
jgi:AcrR family transcriptional regulator